ncbi:hypothetical protein CHS0354_025251 [Potamilus streckersoni]|uniref:Uncharacterized protein n=1 Tax=Potamilus streckersoni TaxID=2493646 RepID=A0AAE0RS40_9BIVA|nr:hypothetical protein CHS0354_025251 [Potamilus streckersoni]
MKIPATRVVVNQAEAATTPKLTRRNISRSAPPARLKSDISQQRERLQKHAQSRPRTGHQATSISLSDIYQLAEREKLSYSATSRRENVERAYEWFRKSDENSRPNTSASGYINKMNRETITPMSMLSEPLFSRPSSVMRATDTEDYEDDEDDYMSIRRTMANISQDCCEIIGPQLCHECRKNRIREMDKKRYDAFFPTLHASEDNLTATAIVKRYLPKLSYPEIEDRIARGEIQKPSLSKKLRQGPMSREDELNKQVDEAKPKYEVEREERMRSMRKSTVFFFANLRALNQKIISGEVNRNDGFSKPTKLKSETDSFLKVDDKCYERESKRKLLKKHGSSMYISPRKVQLESKSKFQSFFEPPLLPRHCQGADPGFFAGSKEIYNLPERLPEELVFVDKNGRKVTRRMSSRVSFRSEFAIPEEESEEEETSNTTGDSSGMKEDPPKGSSIREDEEEAA